MPAAGDWSGDGVMARIDNLFVTQLYREELGGAPFRRLLKDLEHSCRVIAGDDRAGQAWPICPIAIRPLVL